MLGVFASLCMVPRFDRMLFLSSVLKVCATKKMGLFFALKTFPQKAYFQWLSVFAASSLLIMTAREHSI